ncbi:RIP metalloprotease RseP [Acholeplasma sp. OttesenSCG-928-E16]|nr:RIP metalloprotease RseP [Acholeplasma sp. OttesenSCG-928-E16]
MSFWFILLNIVVFILVLGIIVLLHELGHFIVAKKSKVLCHEFAIGMGPTLLKVKKGETVYAIRAIPIGGFVSMAGEDANIAMIKKDQYISVNIDSTGKITEIIIDNAKDGSIYGRVTNFDLFGKDFSPLFIDLDVDGEVIRFDVLRNASYVFGKKTLQIAPQEKSFESKKIWQRMLIIVAGPAMNFVLAFLLFLIVGFATGKPQNTNVIGNIAEGYPVFNKLQAGDKITHIGSKEVHDWDDIGEWLYFFAGKENLRITYERNGVTTDIKVTPLVDIRSVGIANFDPEGKIYSETYIGQASGNAEGFLITGDKILAIKEDLKKEDSDVSAWQQVSSWEDIVAFFKEYDETTVKYKVEREDINDPVIVEYKAWVNKTLESQGVSKIASVIGINPEYKFDFLYAFEYSFKEIGTSSTQIFKTLGMLFSNSQIGVSDLSGPIGIFNLIGQIMRNGFLAVISFTAFLSVNIGIMNLLPIPALDGGRLLFLIYEAITRKKIPPKVENTINNVMFIALMALFLFIAVMDIGRLF